MKRKAWAFVALGAVAVGVVIYVIALGQEPLFQVAPEMRAVHDVTDIYYQLDAKLTEITQKLDTIIGETVPTKAAIQQWEYRVDIGPSTETTIRAQYLNGRGQEGWELVNAIWDDTLYAWHYVFKRPLG